MSGAAAPAAACAAFSVLAGALLARSPGRVARRRAVRRLGGQPWPAVARGGSVATGVGRGAVRLLAHALEGAGIAVEPRLVLRSWAACAALLAAGALAAGGPALVVIAVCSVALAPALWLYLARGRADRALEAAVPELLDAVARALRSGASLPQAIEEAATGAPGRLRSDVDAALALAHAGRPLVEALDDWARRRPVASVRLAVAALALAAGAGGTPARAVEGVATTVRARMAVGAEVRALSAQARYSAAVIGLAPLAFTVVAAATDPATTDFLLRTPLGVACLAGGLGLEAAGTVWMHRLATVRPW